MKTLVTLRALGRSLSIAGQRRTIIASTDQTAKALPRQIGGVHFQDGDRVVLRHKDRSRVRIRLTEPLKRDGITRTGKHSYEIQHNDLIGQPGPRSYVSGWSGGTNARSVRFRATHPSLDEFVSLAPRTVTPIYSTYGGTIITLLDIHVAPPIPSNDPKTSDIPQFKILEAGTGNGGLTLHLARAIMGANPPPPHFEDGCSEDTVAEGWRKWRSGRRAVIHTVEFQETRSRAAEKLIKSFRGALYWPHIDFHSGDVGAWVRAESQNREGSEPTTEGFLDIVILDLPGVHSKVRDVVDAMKEDAQLLVWVPQITQVAACQQQIEHFGLPLKLDRVVELGEGISTGRRWDIRFVKTKAEQKKELESAENQNSEQSSLAEDTVVETERVKEKDNMLATEFNDTAPPEENQSAAFPIMVCRPMVGEMTMGGGFLGLWRKVSRWQKDDDVPQDPEQGNSASE